MNKRFLPIAALGLTAALALAACSSGETPAADNGPIDAKGETLTVWIMEGTNPDSEPFFEKVGEAFTEETGATLDVEYVQWADAHDRFVTSIAGGTTPDVAETGTTWTAEFADAGALAPLTDYVAAEKGLEKDLVDGLEVAGTYDGDLYGMPWYAGVRSIVYRADIFEELGLEAPTSWDEIVSAGEAIRPRTPRCSPSPCPATPSSASTPGCGAPVARSRRSRATSGPRASRARSRRRASSSTRTSR